MSLSVAALIATYRRPAELARLLASLAKTGPGLDAVVVVDNAASEEIRAVVQASGCPAHYVSAAENLGCGGGLKLAAESALRISGKKFTHFVILDDDAVVARDTLAGLATAMETEGADLACPLVVDDRGVVRWLPGLPRTMRLSDGITPEQFRAKFGDQPSPLEWSQGICLLVSRRAIETCGVHRDDFWVRGEDLEFSLRLTAKFRGVFVPGIVVQHLPPPANPSSRSAEYLKHCAMLQNIAYITLRLPHGRRVAWSNVGALKDFLRVWSWRAFPDALRAWWRGVVLGEPAGRGTGRTFLNRLQAS